MSYRTVARDPRDTSGANVTNARIPTCSRCHKDFTEFDDFESDFCEDCQGYIVCSGCDGVVSGSVEVDGERYCRECATEMLREMAVFS